jgi:hypothetical protein
MKGIRTGSLPPLGLALLAAGLLCTACGSGSSNSTRGSQRSPARVATSAATSGGALTTTAQTGSGTSTQSRAAGDSGACASDVKAAFASAYSRVRYSRINCDTFPFGGGYHVGLTFVGDPNREQADTALIDVSPDLQNGSSFFATEQASANQSGALQVTGPKVRGNVTLWFPPGHLLARSGKDDITVDFLPVGSKHGPFPAGVEQMAAKMVATIEGSS